MGLVQQWVRKLSEAHMMGQRMPPFHVGGTCDPAALVKVLLLCVEMS